MAMTQNEINLVNAAKGGDSRAFEELYGTYYNKVFALACMTVRNEADAEDILQQAFINAWRYLGSLADPAAFNTWLQKITLNLCHSLLRKKNIAILLDAESDMDDFGDIESDELLPVVYAEHDDLKHRLGKIIEGLSDVQKQTITLYYFSELKVEEIAYVMECSTGTVKTRLYLARRAIRAEVEEQERISGQKFYGVTGIAMLGLSQLLKQQLGIQAISPATASGILQSISQTIAQDAAGAAAPAVGHVGDHTTASQSSSTYYAPVQDNTPGQQASSQYSHANPIAPQPDPCSAYAHNIPPAATQTGGIAATPVGGAAAKTGVSLAMKIIAGVVAAAVVAGSGTAIYKLTRRSDESPQPSSSRNPSVASGSQSSSSTTVPLLPPSRGSAESNGNFASGGYVTYTQGYTFFCHAENMGSMTLYSIVRIGDTEDAVPESLYSFDVSSGGNAPAASFSPSAPASAPSNRWGNVISLRNLMVYDNKLYFLQLFEDHWSLRWISLDGNDTGVVVPSVDTLIEDGRNLTCDEIIAAFPRAQTVDGLLYIDRWQINIVTGATMQLDCSFLKNDEIWYPVGFYQGYVYYAKTANNEIDFVHGLFRSMLGGGVEEEVCSMYSDEAESLVFHNAPIFSQNYMFCCMDRDNGSTLWSVNLDTGDRTQICNTTYGENGEYNATGDSVYYFNGPNLYRCDLNGSNNSMIIEDRRDNLDYTDGKDTLHIVGDWIYYKFMGSALLFCRVSRTLGQSFSAEPIMRVPERVPASAPAPASASGAAPAISPQGGI